MINYQKFQSVRPLVLALAFAAAGLSTALAQGAAFTYQGRLNHNGSPVTGSYDFEFRLFNAASSGTQQGPAVTLPFMLQVSAVTFSPDARFVALGTAFSGFGSLWDWQSNREVLGSIPAATKAFQISFFFLTANPSHLPEKDSIRRPW